MKIVPWVCFVGLSTTLSSTYGGGLEAYRIGQYMNAASQLTASKAPDPIAQYYLGRMRLYGYGQVKDNTAALASFKASAEKGFLPAQQFMARYALLVDKNPDEALVWFKKAADANDVDAQLYCAAAYLFGFGAKKNEDVAKKYYIAAARNGNATAQNALAESFLETRQLANKKLGLLWLNKAVALLHPGAQVRLGELYLRGELVERDEKKASELIDLALKQGYQPALYAMGELEEAKSNYQDAQQWYVKAVKVGDHRAEIALSRLYFNEKAPFYDPHNGFLWMLKAAQNGMVEAQKNVAIMYQKGQGVEKNDMLAKSWLTKKNVAVKPTFDTLNQTVARWLTHGVASQLSETTYQLRGILSSWHNTLSLKEKHYNAAPRMDWVSRATLFQPRFVMVQPNRISMSEYYQALVSSLGAINQDVLVFPNDASTSLFAKSKPDIELQQRAVLGDVNAQMELGQRLQYGLGIEKNLEQAVQFYKMAAIQQDLAALYHLGSLYLEGSVEGMSRKQGYDLLVEAAFKGYPYAQYAVARLNEQGYRDASGKEWVKANPEQARAMYQLASVNHYGPAQYRLAELMVRDKAVDLSREGALKRHQMIRDLYRGALEQGVASAAVPLAYYDAMDPTKQKEAFLAAQKAAQAGNKQAALLVGLMSDRGLAVEANPSEALKWYQQASGNPVSAFVLGTYLSQGLGMTQDRVKGQTLLKQAADAGFSYALLNLAILNKENHLNFIPELEQSLNAGNSTAGLLLADYALNSDPSGPGVKKAREIYTHFASQGQQESAVKLGYLLEHGLGGAVNLPEAQKWYQTAAMQGDATAQYLLGRWYQLGANQRVPEDDLARKWYSSAQSTYAPAAVALGFLYETVHDRYDMAFKAYQWAANHGNAVAQYNLGLMYEQGKGRLVDLMLAKSWYEKAAIQGEKHAMVQLASLFAHGEGGIARDETQALAWYKKSALLGDCDALYHLGMCAEQGQGLQKNNQEALRYYMAAANQGHVNAIQAVARLQQQGVALVPKTTTNATPLQGA